MTFLSWTIHISGSRVLFTRPTNFTFQQLFIKNGSHGIIHIFKYYFTTVFSVFSFHQNKLYLNRSYVLIWVLMKKQRLASAFSSSSFFFRCTFLWLWCVSSGSHALFTRPTNLFFTKTFIKNGSHGTIHIFKNYFVTVFSIFSFSF